MIQPPGAEALWDSMLTARECVCLYSPASVCGTASRPNAVQAVCPHRKQVSVSALILLEAFPPVFLFHSVFLSVIVVILAAGKKHFDKLEVYKKRKKEDCAPAGDGSGGGGEAIRPLGWV